MGFLILFENLYILRIILGYGNDKLRDGALSISYLRRHPYVLLPFIIIIIIIIIIITGLLIGCDDKMQMQIYRADYVIRKANYAIKSK